MTCELGAPHSLLDGLERANTIDRLCSAAETAAVAVKKESEAIEASSTDRGRPDSERRGTNH